MRTWKTLKLRILVDTLAPIESDGPEDNDEWNLFKQYLPDNSEEEKLHDRTHLSKMLRAWHISKVRGTHEIESRWRPEQSEH